MECAVIGLPAGLGDPMFEGVENRLAAALFGIPAVRGVSFGDGFDAAAMCGSEHNDPYLVKDGSIVTQTNHAGGVLGGITTGMPLVVNVAIKPTPSISKVQKSVNMKTLESVDLVIGGRHDSCIVPRAVAAIEAAVALAVLDKIFEEEA